MTGKMARTKGLNFERDVAKLLRCIYKDARRHLEYQDQEANGVDLVHTGIYKIQCKRGRKWASISAIEEVSVCTEYGEVPVLITKGDNKPSVAVLPLEEFIRLVSRSQALEQLEATVNVVA